LVTSADHPSPGFPGDEVPHMTAFDIPDRPAAAGSDASRYQIDEGQLPSDGVLAALNAVSDEALDPNRPVADYVDLDALDDLFARGGGPNQAGHVTFAHGEFGVRVTADGTVVAWRRAPGDDG
jgi:hypothetical protein